MGLIGLTYEFYKSYEFHKSYKFYRRRKKIT
jgi:hypothetical protein